MKEAPIKLGYVIGPFDAPTAWELAENIHLAERVGFHIAMLGGEIEVPTIHGGAKLKIPAGTESGKIFRLRGQGVVDAAHGRLDGQGGPMLLTAFGFVAK